MVLRRSLVRSRRFLKHSVPVMSATFVAYSLLVDLDMEIPELWSQPIPARSHFHGHPLECPGQLP
jgi:hypothetical protein